MNQMRKTKKKGLIIRQQKVQDQTRIKNINTYATYM